MEGGVIEFFVCLFGVYRPTREFLLTHMETSPGLHILTYVRHSWSLNSEGSLARDTFCDSVITFIFNENKLCMKAYISLGSTDRGLRIHNLSLSLSLSLSISLSLSLSLKE